MDPLVAAFYALGDAICLERAELAAGIRQNRAFAVIVVRASVFPPGNAVGANPMAAAQAMRQGSAHYDTMMMFDETGKAG